MDNLRIGVIGYGYWAPNLVRNFQELPGCDLVVISDLKQNRLEQVRKLYPGVAVTQTYRDLFQMNLAAVVIATPPTTHYRLACECMEKGLHVLVEKPITLISEEADKLCEFATQKDLILMVGHTYLYNRAVLALKKMVANQELGQLYYVDTARLNLGLYQMGLNVMWDLAPHDISIINFILDSYPIEVTAQGTCSVIPNIQDVVYINLFYPNQVMAHIHVSWLDPCKVRRVTVVGSKKMVVYNDVEATEKIKIYDKGVDTTHETSNFQEFQAAYRTGDILIPNIGFTEPLRAECQAFIDCITQHTRPSSCGEDGMRVVKVLEAAQRSLSNSGHMEVIQW
ncbi:MAG: Gfo/Idh/MocA family oxidoreductase [Anaerolineaceae bacterium]|nr:Gfo/Idh/MocA family oxidoreductase [Anaerolineaceae bacterium]